MSKDPRRRASSPVETPGDPIAGKSLGRREFMEISSLAAGSLFLSGMPVMAGPFQENPYRGTIFTDKKLAPEWVASLTARGEKQTYSDPAALDHVGMPVGGFFAGTVYLSGDGWLWLWDVFNRDRMAVLPREARQPGGFSGSFLSGGLNFLHPAPVTQPFRQGFFLRMGGERRPLDRSGFRNVTFDGRYPIGRVSYRDEACPVEVDLEAFSPFIPGRLEDSSLPATIMSYTLTNRSREALDVELSGELENAVCIHSRDRFRGLLENSIEQDEELTALVCSASQVPHPPGRPDIPFEDFERETYAGWTVEGEAFGSGPVAVERIPDYQRDVGGQGRRVVNSHASAPGDDVRERDSGTGRLLSREFRIQRRFINLLVGGGAHQGRTCVNVRVASKVVASVTGANANRMSPRSLRVADHEGRMARLEILDAAKAGWGNIGVDAIVLSDTPASPGLLREQRDSGTMTLALLGGPGTATADGDAAQHADHATRAFGRPLVGRVGRRLRLEPGRPATVTFVVAWHFPNLRSRAAGTPWSGTTAQGDSPRPSPWRDT